ncbi:MAG: WYL domain-containing protein, partial [Gammaproteobacteria bacterium]
MDTFLRRLAILEFLSRAAQPRTTGEIIQHLRDGEYLDPRASDSTCQRLVQRDLNFLLGEEDEDGEALNPFGLVRERGERKTFRWQLDTGAGLRYDFEKMPSFIALTLGMTGKHLGPILPAQTQRELSGFLEQAERRLALESRRLSAHHYRRLKDAVEFSQRGHALRAAPYDPAVLDTCYRAIITQ